MMVMDVANPHFNFDDREDEPNSEAQRFYDMLSVSDKPLWPHNGRDCLMLMGDFLKDESNF